VLDSWQQRAWCGLEHGWRLGGPVTNACSHPSNSGYPDRRHSVHEKVSKNILSITTAWFIVTAMKKLNRNPNSEAFSARLRLAMKQAGLKASATQLADAFNLRYWGEGITAHAARNWITGVSIPKPDKLKTLSELLQISPHDLFFGPETSNLPVNEPVQFQNLCMGDTQMLRQFLKLNPEHQRMIRHWVLLAYLYQEDHFKKKTP
jgi:transcriptional regulator with XRE-family HTH domain